MTKRLRLVEDDLKIARDIVQTFREDGFEVDWISDGQAALQRDPDGADVMVLDLMLPGAFGLDVLKAWRSKTDAPVIVLSAKQDAIVKVRALELGADDYLTKPFSMEELLLRITAVLKRTQRSSEVSPLKIYAFGDFVLHYDEQYIEGPSGKHKLTSKENELIRLLASEINKLVNRSHALKQIWGDDSYFNARSMDVYLSKIRKILKDDPRVQIITVHGEGFKLIVGDA